MKSSTTRHRILLGRRAQAGSRPILRSGDALKRLERDQGGRRWSLRDLGGGSPLGLSDNDVALLELLDGRNSIGDLVVEAERRFGPTGPRRLASLLTDLTERGYVVGAPDTTGAQRVSKRGHAWLIGLAVLAPLGIPAFFVLIASRYGTPFIVGLKIGLGVLVFLLGAWFAFVVHRLGRQLAASPARTSDVWFESRLRRIAVSAAGPLADMAAGAVFAIGCLAVPDGTLRDVCFQFAFASYAAALYALNPLRDSDGYRLLVDLFREPALRRHAAEQLSRRLAGRREIAGRSVAGRYAAFAIGWAALVNVVLLLPPLRYGPILENLVPAAYVWGQWVLVAALWLVAFAPALVVLARPLLDRARGVRTAR